MIGFLLHLVLVQAAVMSVQQGQAGAALCPRETTVFVDAVLNTESTVRAFSVATRGSAAAWAVATPQGFILAPGEEKALYTYVTPFSNVQPGNYLLELVVAAGTDVKVVQHTVTVKSCFDVQLQSPDVVKEACPRQVSKYEFFVANTGVYQEDFVLRTDGLLKEVVTLSDTVVTLKPGERKQVDAYVIAPSDAGEYGFSVVAEGKSGKSVQTVSAVLEVQPCYTFNVEPEKQVYSMCEKTQKIVPVVIENKGTVTNNYLMTVTGPSWAKLEGTGVTLLAGQQGRVNLVLDPGYGVQGNFLVTVEVNPERGDQKALTDIDVEVRKCHSVDAQALQNDVNVCTDGVVRKYEVLVKNDGEVAKQYSIGLDAPSWVSTTTPALVSLQPGTQRVVDVVTQPGTEVVPKAYTATVQVQATDDSGVTAKDTEAVRLNAVSLAACYAPKVSTTYNSLVVYYDSSVTLPVTIQNTGLEQAAYEVVVSGAGTQFAKLNPSTVMVAPGKAETVFLYLAPGPQTPLAWYDLEVGVKVRNSKVLDAQKLAIRVTDKQEEATKLESVISPGSQTWWERVKAWLKENFVPKPGALQQAPPSMPEAKPQEIGAPEPAAEASVPTVGWKEWLQRARTALVHYRYYVLGGIIVLLVVILLTRLNFWEKAVDFFLEEEEMPRRKNKRGKGRF